MKKFLFALLIAISMLGGSSCDNSLNPPVEKEEIVQLVKAPDILTYSGNQILGSTFGTRSINLPAMYGANTNANQWGETWDCIPNVNLTDEELNELKDLLSPGKETYNTNIFPYENYWVSQVYKGQDPEEAYYATDKDNNTTGTKVTGSNQMDKLVARNGSNYEHINNFNNGNNTNSVYDQNFTDPNTGSHNHEGTTLMENMSKEGVTATNQFGFHESFGNADYNNYLMVYYKGYWYVGFDYETHKNVNNPGEAKDVNRDWKFTDWIVRISPAYAKGTTPEQPEVTDPETPNNSLIEEFKDNHVEINLSIEDRGYSEIKWLASHLSIHVRANTDVEVFIPIPKTYVCEADDLVIVGSHNIEFLQYGGPYEIKHSIANKEVFLKVQYTDSGIKVWTEGIDKDVIDYCKEEYNDGITFEIWNYFNITKEEWNHGLEDENGFNAGSDSPITPFELINYLNDSKVWFYPNEDNVPGLYVNAFMYDPENKDIIFNYDCTVEPQEYPSDQSTGSWYNGSPFNELYKKN